jgi:large subunit ribosomal protein L20
LPRAKGGIVTHRKHKKVLELTKGHRGKRHNLVKVARESMLHALDYAYCHRRERRGDMRRLWIMRINAAARVGGVSYNQLMKGLKKADIVINRKMLADMAVNDPTGFSKLLKLASDKSNN